MSKKEDRSYNSLISFAVALFDRNAIRPYCEWNKLMINGKRMIYGAINDHFDSQ